jgi:hypothetical protein
LRNGITDTVERLDTVPVRDLTESLSQINPRRKS